MTTKEEYFRNVMKNTIKNAVQTLLRTREFSKRFLAREDQKEIDKKIDKISDEIMNLFVSKLRERGYLENDKKPSKGEFEKLLKLSINEYFGETGESDSR